jgi:galacturan 1,4-alpha-galacturonidase
VIKDGWDLYRSHGIVVQNSYISNDDDCVSFKPNSTNIVVQNLICTGSHGISVGSLGEYLGEVDIAGKSISFSALGYLQTDYAKRKPIHLQRLNE